MKHKTDRINDKILFDRVCEYYWRSPSLIFWRVCELTLLRNVNMNEPILDLGCGDGFIASMLKVKRISAGVDINDAALLVAKGRDYYESFTKGDACQLPFPDESFNTVLSNCAMEHMQNIELVLKEISRVLRPHGKLIMTVPSEIYENFFFLNFLKLKKLNTKAVERHNIRQAHLNVFSPNKTVQHILSHIYKIFASGYHFKK